MQVDFSAGTVNLSYLLNGQNPAPPETVRKENKESAIAPPEKTDSANEQTANKPQHPNLANRQVVFDVVPGSKDIIVKVVDPSTGEVVRQIPGEKFHEFAPHVNKYR